ncbi:energy transducer TonB [Flavobacterium urocaniciphilum]|uniref:Outer membrane transport energization protein TonB n=1 Tax=Flavobacterium urocaniciphilum TaxID=1299341 RepID=A0A1H8YR27_9FLAO|nr:energy transducer TonB [Flavobacterium urocaniciphilum]SEP54665.1 outer membrane transport energization protein TonB [Flavobacterium urocaniciphilum]
MNAILKILKLLYEHGFFGLVLFIILAISIWVVFHYVKKTKLTDSKQSLIVTTHSVLCIIILLFFIRFWPPYNNKTALLIAEGGGGGGVSVNFGDTDFGKGNDYLNETLEVNMKEIASEPEESVPDDILTQDNVGANVTTPPKTNIKPKDKKPTETKPVENPKTPVKKPNSALSNMIKGKNKGGDGNSSSSGNQGSANGNLNSNGYYGSGGSGGGTGGGNGTGNGTGTGPGSGSGSGGGNGSGIGKGNYNLAGRRTAYIPPTDNDCNQSGRVIIEVTVDRSGKVISAVNGKGSTADACLIALAKKYAYQTRWQPSETAAEKQVGNITYNFSF